MQMIQRSLFSAENTASLEFQVKKELASLENWLIANKLSLNISKTEFMLVTTSQRRAFIDDKLSINPRGLEWGQIDPPSIFLALNFCSLTDCQKLWHNCSLFVNTSFDTN